MRQGKNDKGQECGTKCLGAERSKSPDAAERPCTQSWILVILNADTPHMRQHLLKVFTKNLGGSDAVGGAAHNVIGGFKLPNLGRIEEKI